MKRIIRWDYCRFLDSQIYMRIRFLFLIFVVLRSMFINEFTLAQKFNRDMESKIVLKQNENEIERSYDLFKDNIPNNYDNQPSAINHEATWNWLNPKPQGNDLRALWVFDEDNFISLGAFATLVSSDNQGQSVKVQYNIAGQINTLNDLTFITNDVGLAVGNQGKILRTTDRGQNWYLISSPTTKSLNGIAFASDSIGVIVGERGNMFRTNDAGNSWQVLPIVTQLHLFDVGFISENVGLAVGRAIALMTTDAGLTWNVLTNAPLSDIDLYSICFRDSTTVITTGGGWNGGEIILKYDLFTNQWTILQTGQLLQQNIFTSVSFADKNNGVVAGTSGLIYYSSNQGLSWQQASIDNPTNATLTSVFLLRNGFGYAVGYSGIILFTSNHGHTWTNLTQIITSQFLTGISFPNLHLGFAVGDAATIIHTSDGGRSWVRQNLPLAGGSDHFHGVSFANSLVGNAVGVFGLIARTNDGGINWEWQQARSGDTLFLYNFYAVDLLNTNIGLLAGHAGLIFRTTNGGSSWYKVRGFSQEALFGIQFINTSVAFAVGSDGTVLKSTDAGISWTKQISNTAETLWSVYFIDNYSGFIVGSNGTILKTSNGGIEWVPQTSNTNKHLYCVWASDESTVFAFGVGGTFLKSTDGGLLWTLLILPTGNSIRGISGLNRDTIIVSGGSGTILSTHIGGGILSVQDANPMVESNYFLSQNYPNPFNPSTKIRWHSNEANWQTLRIFDVLGNEVVTLIDEYRPAGINEVEFFPKAELASGIYFYQLKAGDFIKTKKMLLLK